MIWKLIIVSGFFGCLVNGQMNPGCYTLINNRTQCQSGDKALPQNDYPNLITEIEVLTLFNSKLAIKTACKSANIALYKEAAVCLVNSYRHCGDNDFKTLVITSEKFESAFDIVCEDPELYDHILNCLSSSFTDCLRNKRARQSLDGARPSIDKQFTEFIKYYCGRIQIEDECIAEDIDVQNCLEEDSFNKYKDLRTILLPEACNAPVPASTAIVLHVFNSLLLISLFTCLVL